MNLFKRRDKKDDTRRTADKIFLQSFIISIIGAIITITALSTSTWAWFVGSVNSNTNSLKAASCEIDIYVSKTLGIAPASENNGEQSPSTSSNVYSWTAEKDTKYTVSLVPYGSASTCYCVVVINGEKYLTKQMNVPDEMDMNFSFDFTIISEEAVHVSIIKRWGTAILDNSLRPIIHGNDYKITDGKLEKISKEEAESQVVKDTDVVAEVVTEAVTEEVTEEVTQEVPETADTESVPAENDSSEIIPENEKSVETESADVGEISQTPTDQPQNDVELTADPTEAETDISAN